jgi:aminoglycoside phosphotransferase (APT) family kinase protein
VRRYACDVVGDSALKVVTSIARFEGGDRHAVFKVSYASGPNSTGHLVVRVSIRSDAAEREQVAREGAVLASLAGSAAPRLLDVSCDSRWLETPAMCTEFIEGSHRDFASVRRSELEALGTVVGSVHVRPVDDLAELFPGPQTVAGYLDQWSELIAGYLPKLRQPLPEPVGTRIIRGVPLATRALDVALRDACSGVGGRLVLLHGDVGPGNILWSDRPVLIDWEYARLGDPADDVAYIFGQHSLNPLQREAFWSGYRRWVEPPDLERTVERARLWEPVILLGSALWWLERWSARAEADDAGGVDASVPKPQSYYFEQAVRRLDRFETAVTRLARRSTSHSTPPPGL